MLKNRTFLIGLGAGIIIGAMLFQIMLLGEQTNQNLQQIDIELNERLYTQEEVDAMLKTERTAAAADVQTKTEGAQQAEQPPVSNDPDKMAQSTADKPAQHVIHIVGGTGLTKTAELLAKYNVIQDKAGFINQMKQSKKRVRAGYFLFQEGIAAAEAIKIVTNQPLTKKQADAMTAKLRSGQVDF